MRVPLRGNSWRLLLPAALLLALLCVVASAPAETLEEKLQDTQGKLSDVRENQSALAATIAEQNKAIDSMIGEVSALRQQQAAVEAELSAKQDELDRATAKLEADKRHLARVRARLQRALEVLRDRLVAIYESGSPDMLNVVLDSASWSEVNTRADYLNQIQEYDDSVAARVKALRDQARAAVKRMTAVRLQIKDARDAIAVKEREVASARQEAEARFAELKSAQAERQAALESLESREEALSDNLACDLRTDRQHHRRAGAGHRHPGAADPRRERQLHLRKPGQRAERGSGGGRRRDRSRQLDRHHALHLGRRPRLLRILGLRLLRRGQLRPQRRRLPLQPARLDRPRDLGRTRARASGSPSTPTPATPG